jgi:hypothetical protein
VLIAFLSLYDRDELGKIAHFVFAFADIGNDRETEGLTGLILHICYTTFSIHLECRKVRKELLRGQELSEGMRRHRNRSGVSK